jgi:DNA polymerase-3 subunit delta'
MKAFAEIRGHDATIAFLRQAWSHERLAHALLFSGPAGIGKRGVAMAFAAWVQCEESAADNACGVCVSCRQVGAGTHPDVKLVEADAGKKEIGVDKAREVKRFTQLAPAMGRVKVAILDDAHRLSVAAQNGLLKTLEDPPGRSILILVSNSPDSLLPTVRSRCQRVRFQPLSHGDVAAVLMEGHGLDPAEAARLSAVCEGSPRRALDLQASVDADGSLLDAIHRAQGAPYADLASLVERFGEPEAEVAARLEVLLAEIRDAAASLVASGAAPSTAVRRLLAQGDMVRQAAETLRRTNPNRQLLLESLLLRLTSPAG